MSTFDYYFEMPDNQLYNEYTDSIYTGPADNSGNYNAIIKVGDTINVRTVYTGTDTANISAISYLANPNADSAINDPDATVVGTPTATDATWTLTASDNTDHYARWYWFANGTDPSARLSVRILILPNTFGFTGIPNRIGPGGREDISITMPTTLHKFLDGTYDVTDQPGFSPGYDYDSFDEIGEKFRWRITTDAAGNNLAPSSYFEDGENLGTLIAPRNGDTISIRPKADCPVGTYYLFLHHFNTTPQYQSTGSSPSTTGGSSTVISSAVLNIQNDPYLAIKSVQVDDIDDSLVELFELELATSGQTFYFHNGLDYENKTIGENIYFPNKAGTVLNEYVAFPIKIENLGVNSTGAETRPTLTLANIPALARTYRSVPPLTESGYEDETTILAVLQEQGILSTDDLLYSKLTYRTTLLKYTYRLNDTATIGTEYPSSVFYLERISGDNNKVLEFELISPADLEGLNLPNRVVVGKYCSWEYQGAQQYRGGCTVDKNSFYRWFDKDDQLIWAGSPSASPYSTYNSSTTYSIGDIVRHVHPTLGGWRFYRALLPSSSSERRDPVQFPFYWERLDVCSKTLRGCKLRFQGIQINISTDRSTLVGTVPSDDYLNENKSLPFGGFPGAKKFK